MEFSETVQAKSGQSQGCRTQVPAVETIEIEVGVYNDIFEGNELNEVQKREFLRSLHAVIWALINLNYDVHPVDPIKPTFH
ncbi:hypothetical protein [Pelagimonas varians]|uniref:Uncharacterized protein n=1 Tax=Pelagimonas varians TaxID=696760 RepID=A0A238KDX0_9RHOB|nr:hypothetical protein [Pelagimonas varians]PYG29841.1 hypothetical protein C8N36_1076 [Pelagimonas varians]SMX41013.1 hypothetical protein PEV8663_02188 [Pelagimonas varians]